MLQPTETAINCN